ncbi:MAG: VCBS repeat-containing protein [Myxococcota bacterium]
MKRRARGLLGHGMTMGRQLFTVIATGALLAGSLEACSSDGDAATTATTGSGGQATGGGDGAGGDGFGGRLCIPGDTCGDGQICTEDGTCCDEERACGAACCGDDAVCSFEQCQVPGALCIDAGDCADGEYCEYGLGEGDDGSGGSDPMCVGGVEPPTGRCLPTPPECGPGEDPGDPPSCIQKCEFIPDPGQFDPEVKFAWGDVTATNHDVMMAPVVTQLDDDDCDGDVDERDIPDIVFFTFEGSDYNNNGGSAAALRAISIINGQVEEKWTVDLTDDEPGRSIASGDIHPAPGNEIVVCTQNQRVRAYDAMGAVLWTSEPIGRNCFMPSIADFDQNGQPEVLVVSAILDGATGAIDHTIEIDSTTLNNGNVVASDVTGDGQLDVVTSTRVFDATGNLVVHADTITGNHPAVGDLDRDGIPEIVTVNNLAHTMSVWRVDPMAPDGFVVVRHGLDINGTINPNPCCAINPNNAGCNGGGGPPTIADFNGDGFPDVGLAGGIGYAMFDGQSLMDTVNVADADTLAWLKPTQDCSSAQTGSSVFDFDGDGSAEVVYADEVTLHIYAGATGDDLFSACNTSGTLWEYPLVADVDSDGHADIVVASNRYSGLACAGGVKTTGVRVFGDTLGKWVRTRRIWNQHAYQVTNVEEDGTIPVVQAANHLEPRLNNFRQNIAPQGERSAPDLVVAASPICTGTFSLVAEVRNVGQASVPAGVVVGFYEGDPSEPGSTRLGEAATTRPLYALGSETLRFDATSPPTGNLYVVVDDDPAPKPWVECRPDNNTFGPISPDCGIK